MVRTGEVIASKYRVERLLGRGGMGYVVSALHLQLGKTVAIKLLNPALANQEDAAERFLREARAAARIESEHIAHVLDADKLPDGRPFIVMEFLEGRDLANVLNEQGRLSVEQTVDYVLQACEALAEAHAQGIVHRDLKPANLFVTQRRDGSDLVKVLDFGIAKALVQEEGQDAVSLTGTQGFIGSPHYMSPEQVRWPKTVDARSDIWSIGIILHELLSGATPFGADSPMAILAGVLSDDPPSLSALRYDVPPALDAVIRRCLIKDPEGRYRDVIELAADLRAFAPRRGEAAYDRIVRMDRHHQDRVGSGPRPITSAPDAPTLESGAPGDIAMVRSTPAAQGERPSRSAAAHRTAHAQVASKVFNENATPSDNAPSPTRSAPRSVLGLALAITLGALAVAASYGLGSRSAESEHTQPSLAPLRRAPELVRESLANDAAALATADEGAARSPTSMAKAGTVALTAPTRPPTVSPKKPPAKATSPAPVADGGIAVGHPDDPLDGRH